ncbi:hypothetical protein GJAV_G00087110 [Gymnothorax javanicus]|nr:hypothetical protein GJAV_G00087110 [Gymnothorax javanicus]
MTVRLSSWSRSACIADHISRCLISFLPQVLLHQQSEVYSELGDWTLSTAYEGTCDRSTQRMVSTQHQIRAL